MKKILLHSFAFFITSLSITHLHTESLEPIIIKDYFGETKYTVTIFDLAPYIDEYSENNLPEEEKLITSLSLLGLETKKVKKTGLHVDRFLKTRKDTSKLLKKDSTNGTIAFATSPDERVAKTMQFMQSLESGNNRTPYEVHLMLRGGEKKNSVKHTISNQALHRVPTLIKKGQEEPTHHRHNLFDMLSTQLDQHLEHFGIWQEICHETNNLVETHQEISMFAAISCDYGYNILGVMQYTFNKKDSCYHRAFKPFTETHILYFSNTKTQKILRYAIYDLVEDALGNKKTPSAKKLAKFLSQLNDEETKEIKATMKVIDGLYNSYC